MFVEIKTFKNRSNDICKQMFHLKINETKGNYQLNSAVLLGFKGNDEHLL